MVSGMYTFSQLYSPREPKIETKTKIAPVTIFLKEIF